MTAARTTKTITVLASAALIAASMLGGTADAKKKKKPKPPPPPPACAAYEPSQWSADVPVTTITDEHTADKPFEVTVPTEMGVGSSDPENPANTADDNPVSHVYLNVQVDSALPTVGLYGTLEFTPAFDYDLYFRGNDGIALAYSAGTSHLIPAEGWNGTGNGGHSDAGSENIDGLETTDCTGYLVHIVSSVTPGEDVTLKLWTGEPAYVAGS